MAYSDLLRDPRWQKKRLEILERDGWQCRECGDDKATLHVHHLWYPKGAPWEAPGDILMTLCERCHEEAGDSARESLEGLGRALTFLSSSTNPCYGLWSALECAMHEGLPDHPFMVGGAIEWAISDPAMLKWITERYDQHLAKITEKRVA